MPRNRPLVGLALGGGSARGWAHFGVFQALAECGIPVDFVAGTSIGALAGVVYASGATESFLEIVPRLDWKRLASFWDVVFPRSGLIDGKKIEDYVRRHVSQTDLRDLPIPFRAVATDLATGREVVLREGDAIQAVRASMALPGILTPVKRGGDFLVDGGLVNPVPINVVREMGAEVVIAVDLNHDIVEKKGYARRRRARRPAGAPLRWAGRKLAERSKLVSAVGARWEGTLGPLLARARASRDSTPSIFDILLSSISIMQAEITAARLRVDPPEVLLQPSLGHIRLLEFHRAAEGIEAGYEEAMSKLEGWKWG
ncbi:MAG: putative NTE family protein [bacterium]|nr:putative NTE family protein [bacterium]